MTNEPPEHDLAVVRLGADSVAEINRIIEVNSETDLPFDIEITCKQVPRELADGTFAFIWLGTHNNKGAPTPWVQGLRALGRITNIEGGSNRNDPKTVSISVGVVFPDSLTKKDFVRQSGDNYINISDLPVVGINNYSSQVIQRIDPAEESQQVDVLVRAIADLVPSFAPDMESSYPELADLLHVTPRPPVKESESAAEKLSIEIPENDLGSVDIVSAAKQAR